MHSLVRIMPIEVIKVSCCFPTNAQYTNNFSVLIIPGGEISKNNKVSGEGSIVGRSVETDIEIP